PEASIYFILIGGGTPQIEGQRAPCAPAIGRILDVNAVGHGNPQRGKAEIESDESAHAGLGAAGAHALTVERIATAVGGGLHTEISDRTDFEVTEFFRRHDIEVERIAIGHTRVGVPRADAVDQIGGEIPVGAEIAEGELRLDRPVGRAYVAEAVV